MPIQTSTAQMLTGTAAPQDLGPIGISGVVLALLWGLEAALPALECGRAGWSQRLRHIALGAINAVPAAGMALCVAWASALLCTADIGLACALGWHDGSAGAAPQWWLWGVVLAGAVLLLDLAGYGLHVLMHRVPVLWRVHAVHHHADKLEATTALRFHVIEIALHHAALGAAALALGVGPAGLAAYHALVLPASLFHHADIRLHPRVERALRLVIVTPAMHWVHHSRWHVETDSNYAGLFSFWDRLFGTLRLRGAPESVDVGLDGFLESEVRTLRGMLRTPFSASRAKPGAPAKSPERRSIPDLQYERVPPR